MKYLILYLVVFHFPLIVFAQEQENLQRRTGVTVHFKTGLTQKIGIGDYASDESVQQVSQVLLYTDPEKNILGPSLDLGVEVKFQALNAGLEYRMGLRYDHLYYHQDVNSVLVNSVNQLFYEHYLNINKYFGRDRLKPLITSGFSSLNRGASYRVSRADLPIEEYDLKANTFNLGVGFQLDQFSFVFRNHFVGADNNPFSFNGRSIFEAENFSIQEITIHYTF